MPGKSRSSFFVRSHESDDSGTNTPELNTKMARREECIPRWLWHAFDALDNEKNGTAPKTELRVLTAHIGNSLGASNSQLVANDLIKKFEDSPRISFQDYRSFLQDRDREFLVLENIDLAKLEEVSWMICGSRYENRNKQVLGPQEVYRMWRIFNFFAEPGNYPVALDPQEATIMFEKLVVAMGTKWSSEEFQFKMAALMKDLKFTSCLQFFEHHYTQKVDKMCVTEGITEVYNTVIEEVEKMGHMKKKGHKVTNWKDRWFILKPGSMAYYVDKTLREQKGDIPITPAWEVEVIADQKGYKNLFVLFSGDASQGNVKRRYELSASDPKTRQEWITAIDNVLKRMRDGHSPHVDALERRRLDRRTRREEAEEVERLRKLQIEENERQRLRLREMERLRDEAARRAEEELALRMAKEKEEEENRRREQEERARTQEEMEALRAARDAAARKAEEELALRKAKEKEEEENRRREQEERAKTEEEINRLRNARDEASRQAAEELALRLAKEEEERENRRREQEERARTQEEMEALRAAHEEAERRAAEEAARQEARHKEEEQRRILEEEEKERQARELEDLKKAYEDVTKRAEIEARLKEAEMEQKAELREEMERLELLLDEERQAKRDEEIVRALQSRILNEETEKREQLERLREEQDALLRQETERREHLEQRSEELVQQRQEQARQLEVERLRLQELEDERREADQKLKAAMDKLSQAEEAKKRHEKKRKELEKPIGLARLIQPRANPLITHRGAGAFSEVEFQLQKERRQMQKQNQAADSSVCNDVDSSLEAGQESAVNGVSENGMEEER